MNIRHGERFSFSKKRKGDPYNVKKLPKEEGVILVNEVDNTQKLVSVFGGGKDKDDTKQILKRAKALKEKRKVRTPTKNHPAGTPSKSNKTRGQMRAANTPPDAQLCKQTPRTPTRQESPGLSKETVLRRLEDKAIMKEAMANRKSSTTAIMKELEGTTNTGSQRGDTMKLTMPAELASSYHPANAESKNNMSNKKDDSTATPAVEGADPVDKKSEKMAKVGSKESHSKLPSTARGPSGEVIPPQQASNAVAAAAADSPPVNKNRSSRSHEVNALRANQFTATITDGAASPAPASGGTAPNSAQLQPTVAQPAAAVTPPQLPVAAPVPADSAGPKSNNQQQPSVRTLQQTEEQPLSQRLTQLGLQPQARKPTELAINTDEILRIGAVLEQFGMTVDRKRAFEWLSMNRTYADREKTAQNLSVAIGDLVLSKQLLKDVICVLEHHSVLTHDEASTLWKTLIKEETVTIGMFAIQLRERARIYGSSRKS